MEKGWKERWRPIWRNPLYRVILPADPNVTLSFGLGVETQNWLKNLYYPLKWRTSFSVTIEATLTRHEGIEAHRSTDRPVWHVTLKGDTTFSQLVEVASSQENSWEHWSLIIWLIEWLSSSDEVISIKEGKKKRDQVEKKNQTEGDGRLAWSHTRNPKEDLAEDKWRGRTREMKDQLIAIMGNRK